MSDPLRDSYDVIVIGGGPAGLNGALMLARSRRAVLVVDAGAPRNAPADGVHGLLGHDGTPPKELLERGRDEVRRYDGHIRSGEVVGAARDGDMFDVTLDSGTVVRGRRLLVTTGVIDELPDLPGIRERWGHDVLHCPYCHGWEVRDKAIGVLASGPNSVHQALLFRQLSDDVLYFSHSMPPTDEDAEKLSARDVSVIEGEVESLELTVDRLSGVRLSDGTVVEREVVVIAPRLVVHAGFLADLGLSVIEHPSGTGEYIKVDENGATSVPGVWAAGNVTDLAAQVGAAAAAGAGAAARINADLVEEDTRRALEESQSSLNSRSGAEPAIRIVPRW